MGRRGLPVWPGHAGDGDVAIAVAAARDHTHQAEAMRQSHDFVVGKTGRLRAGPVTWRVFHRDEGLQALRELGVYDHDPRLGEYLADAGPGALVVVAAAATDKPRRSRKRGRR